MSIVKARTLALVAAALLALPLAAPVEVRAQEAPESSAAGPIPLTQGLRPLLSEVRVRTGAGSELQGRYLRTRADTLVLRPPPRGLRAADPVRLPLLEVDSLWVRSSAWRRGAAIGALVGAALYAAVSTGIEDGDPAAAGLMLPGTIAEGVVMGVVVGGGWGAFVGSRFRRWQLHYSAPPPG
jgi:hypothetical protein